MREDSISRAVLVTGCSSGIGRATALRLMRAAVAAVRGETGAVGVLINNAGYSQSGALESVSMELARRQFETNVFGPLRLTQLALPGMREQRWGKIVNLSSMGGKLTFPGSGLYHASKHAIEALSDALRFEVRGFGVDVVVIEPGVIHTRFGETAAAGTGADDVQDGDGAYRQFNAAVAAATRMVYTSSALARLGGEPERVAAVIERAISARRPRGRYRVTPSARLLLALHAALPDRAWDGILRLQYPTPGARRRP